MTRLFTRAFSQAWLLLPITMLFWAGNSVASRAIVGHMSPMAVVTLRWLVVCGILLYLLQKQLVLHGATLVLSWRRIVLMALFGFTGFNTLFYIAAYHTTAINLTLLQTTIPAFVVAGAAWSFGTRITGVQMLGLVLTLFSVVLVATHGEPGKVLELSFNYGDVLILLACLFYAGYTLALRHRPAVPGLVYFTAMACVALASSIPLALAEIAAGQAYWPSVQGWLILIYISFGPSLLSQIFFIRGVELIGPSRAGIFTNLVPVFGAILAVVVLGEEFHLYHALALGLGLFGIWLSEQAGGRA